jgi:hypothetical protein
VTVEDRFHSYLPRKPFIYACYSATREVNYPAISSARRRGDSGGKAQFVFTGGYVSYNHRRFSPGGSNNASSEVIDHMTITVQLVRLMYNHNKTYPTKQRELFRSRDHDPLRTPPSMFMYIAPASIWNFRMVFPCHPLIVGAPGRQPVWNCFFGKLP